MNADDKNNLTSPTGTQVAMPDTKKSEVHEIPLEKIRVNKFWHRRDAEEGLDSLAKSIEKTGLLQFPRVIEDGDGFYSLVFGHRRYLSHKRLGRKTILCYVIKATSSESAFLCFIENDIRKNMNPADQARILKQIQDQLGLTAEKIAEKIHRPPTFVRERLALMDLPEGVRNKIDTRPESPLTFTKALALSQLARTDRFYHRVELDDLYNKTFDYNLRSSEVLRLVHMVKNGDFDKLPGKLRVSLFKNKYMTAEMADLFLRPEKFFKGNGSGTELLKETARNLTPSERTSIVETALDENWAEDKIGKHLATLLKHSEFEPKKQNAAEILISEISSLTNKLEDIQYQLSNFKPRDVDKLCEKSELLVQAAKSFMSTATELSNENKNTTEKS